MVTFYLLFTQGYKTAYNYRNPDIFKSAKEPTPSKSPTKIPPVRRLVDQDTDGVPVRRAKSLGRANEYKNRAKWLKSPVKSTQFKQQIPEPEMTELDWENRKDLENNNMKKQDKNIPRVSVKESEDGEQCYCQNLRLSSTINTACISFFSMNFMKAS